MASIDTVVNVTVDRQLQAVTVNGYNLAMFLGLHKGFTERYRVYGSLEEVANDFATTSAEYKAAALTFGQEISVNRMAIGRQDSTTATLTPVVANSTNYTVILNRTTYTFPSDVDATATEIVAGLVALINAGTEPVTASGTTTLILTPDVAGVPFTVKASTNLTPVYATTESLTDAVNAVILANNDWYGLMGYSHVKADQLELAAVAQAARKKYYTSSNDLNIVNQTFNTDTTSVAKAFNSNSYDRAAVFFSADAADYPEAAAFSIEFGYAPGTATMKFKTMVGVEVDNLTTTQITNALAKKANVFVPFGLNGENKIIEEGTMSDGTFADIIRDLDFAVSDLQASVFQVLLNLPKVPFTQRGIDIIEGVLRASMLRSVDLGIFADDTDFIIDMPTVNEVSSNDRTQRKLTGIKITARMAGAIHYVQIQLSAYA